MKHKNTVAREIDVIHQHKRTACLTRGQRPTAPPPPVPATPMAGEQKPKAPPPSVLATCMARGQKPRAPPPSVLATCVAGEQKPRAPPPSVLATCIARGQKPRAPPPSVLATCMARGQKPRAPSPPVLATCMAGGQKPRAPPPSVLATCVAGGQRPRAPPPSVLATCMAGGQGHRVPPPPYLATHIAGRQRPKDPPPPVPATPMAGGQRHSKALSPSVPTNSNGKSGILEGHFKQRPYSKQDMSTKNVNVEHVKMSKRRAKSKAHPPPKPPPPKIQLTKSAPWLPPRRQFTSRASQLEPGVHRPTRQAPRRPAFFKPALSLSSDVSPRDADYPPRIIPYYPGARRLMAKPSYNHSGPVFMNTNSVLRDPEPSFVDSRRPVQVPLRKAAPASKKHYYTSSPPQRPPPPKTISMEVKNKNTTSMKMVNMPCITAESIHHDEVRPCCCCTPTRMEIKLDCQASESGVASMSTPIDRETRFVTILGDAVYNGNAGNQSDTSQNDRTAEDQPSVTIGRASPIKNSESSMEDKLKSKRRLEIRSNSDVQENRMDHLQHLYRSSSVSKNPSPVPFPYLPNAPKFSSSSFSPSTQSIKSNSNSFSPSTESSGVQLHLLLIYPEIQIQQLPYLYPTHPELLRPTPVPSTHLPRAPSPSPVPSSHVSRDPCPSPVPSSHLPRALSSQVPSTYLLRDPCPSPVPSSHLPRALSPQVPSTYLLRDSRPPPVTSSHLPRAPSPPPVPSHVSRASSPTLDHSVEVSGRTCERWESRKNREGMESYNLVRDEWLPTDEKDAWHWSRRNSQVGGTSRSLVHEEPYLWTPEVKKKEREVGGTSSSPVCDWIPEKIKESQSLNSAIFYTHSKQGPYIDPSVYKGSELRRQLLDGTSVDKGMRQSGYDLSLGVVSGDMHGGSKPDKAYQPEMSCEQTVSQRQTGSGQSTGGSQIRSLMFGEEIYSPWRKSQTEQIEEFLQQNKHIQNNRDASDNTHNVNKNNPPRYENSVENKGHIPQAIQIYPTEVKKGKVENLFVECRNCKQEKTGGMLEDRKVVHDETNELQSDETSETLLMPHKDELKANVREMEGELGSREVTDQRTNEKDSIGTPDKTQDEKGE